MLLLTILMEDHSDFWIILSSDGVKGEVGRSLVFIMLILRPVVRKNQ